MPCTSSHQQFLSDELNSLMHRSRRLQQMLLLGESIDERVFVEFQSAVDSIRDTSSFVRDWITAAPEERALIMTKIAEYQIRAATRAMKGIVVDLQSGELDKNVELLRVGILASDLQRRIAVTGHAF